MREAGLSQAGEVSREQAPAKCASSVSNIFAGGLERCAAWHSGQSSTASRG